MLTQRCFTIVMVSMVVFMACDNRIHTSLYAEEPATAAINDSAAKQAILESPEWIEAANAFQGWLSVQIEYPKEQVPDLEAGLQDRIEKMTASELRAFLADLQRKLDILLGPDAMETRSWAKQRLELLSAAKAAEFRKSLPDVLNMSSIEVKQAMEDIRLRRANDDASIKAFERFREEMESREHDKRQARAATTVPSWGGQVNVSVNNNTHSTRPFRRFPGVGARGFGGGGFGGFGFGGFGFGGGGWG